LTELLIVKFLVLKTANSSIELGLYSRNSSSQHFTSQLRHLNKKYGTFDWRQNRN